MEKHFSESIEKLKSEWLRLADNFAFQANKLLMGDVAAYEAEIYNHRQDCAREYGRILDGDDYLHIDTRGVYKMRDFHHAKIMEDNAIQMTASVSDIQKRRKLLVELKKAKIS